jgi:hypothetical protein
MPAPTPASSKIAPLAGQSPDRAGPPKRYRYFANAHVEGNIFETISNEFVVEVPFAKLQYSKNATLGQSRARTLRKALIAASFSSAVPTLMRMCWGNP